jgi:hypothetical protein
LRIFGYLLAAALVALSPTEPFAQYGFNSDCPGQWVNHGGGMGCRCSDGSFANYSMSEQRIICPQLAAPQQQEPVGDHCGNGITCSVGYLCSTKAFGRCYPASNLDCGTYNCAAGFRCARKSQTCLPEDADECPNGSYCIGGRKCARDTNNCIPRDVVDCGDGRTCPSGQVCVLNGHLCMTPEKAALFEKAVKDLKEQRARRDAEAAENARKEAAALAQAERQQKMQAEAARRESARVAEDQKHLRMQIQKLAPSVRRENAKIQKEFEEAQQWVDEQKRLKQATSETDTLRSAPPMPSTSNLSIRPSAGTPQAGSRNPDKGPVLNPELSKKATELKPPIANNPPALPSPRPPTLPCSTFGSQDATLDKNGCPGPLASREPPKQAPAQAEKAAESPFSKQPTPDQLKRDDAPGSLPDPVAEGLDRMRNTTVSSKIECGWNPFSICTDSDGTTHYCWGPCQKCTYSQYCSKRGRWFTSGCETEKRECVPVN